MSFGQRLRGLRRDLDLGQAELADRAACSINTVRKLESDERRPSRELAARLADVFELPPRERADFLRLARGTQSVGRPAMPSPMTRLIGREQDVAAIRERVREAGVRLLTLAGPPGVGKTRLALQVATELQEGFRDGAAFVALASVSDAALVLETIAQTLGLRGSASRSLEQVLVEHLRPRNLLLVLDNFEQVSEAGGQVAALLSDAPRLSILVTSREALGVYGEHVFSVPTLGLPDPVKPHPARGQPRSPSEVLFLERARAARPSFAGNPLDQPIVAEICVRLEGLPLALELAASRASTMSPKTLLDELGQRLDVLSAGPTNLPPRQRSARGALDWSFDLLGKSERRLFAQLALFSGGATLDAIEAVCADTLAGDTTPRNAVEALTDKSLLYVSEVGDTTRFQMLETIRAYALERLAQLDGGGQEPLLRRRHAEYFTALAEQAVAGLKGPDQIAWLQRLDADHDNLRAAVSWSLEAGADELAARLCAALWPFWQTRGYVHEGRRWFSAALTPDRNLPPLVRAATLNGAGVLAVNQNDYAVAEALLTQARDLYAALGQASGLAQTLNDLAWVAHECSDYDRAESLNIDSLTLRRQLGESWGEARSLNNLGMLGLERGDTNAAAAFFSDAVALFRRLGDARGSLQALTNLGWATQELGDFVRATALFTEALSLAQRLADARSIANNLSNLALMALYRADYPKASDLFADSLAAFNELGDRRGVAEALEGLAGVAGVESRPQQAARLFGLAEALREAIGAPLLPHDQSRYTATISAAREQLDANTWARAWAEGRATPIQDGIAALLE
jgi:predicted ATPase/DNA-binding XRE family transcriptional regulator